MSHFENTSDKNSYVWPFPAASENLTEFIAQAFGLY